MAPSLSLTALLTAALLATACAAPPATDKTADGPKTRSMNIDDLAKHSTGQIAELHVLALRDLTRQLLIKLYRRNPRELAKVTGASIDSRLEQLFDGSQTYQFAELDNKTGTDAIELVFDEAFKGDRVFALLVGLKSMLHASYNYRTEFYYFDDIDPQKLYHSARNLEVISWRLNNRRNSRGELFLLSNGYSGQVPNFSYERIFAKMIALQDMIAQISAEHGNRTIINVVQSAASSVLIPIGI